MTLDALNQFIDYAIRGMLLGVTLVFWAIGITSILSAVKQAAKKLYRWITSQLHNAR